MTADGSAKSSDDAVNFMLGIVHYSSMTFSDGGALQTVNTGTDPSTVTNGTWTQSGTTVTISANGESDTYTLTGTQLISSSAPLDDNTQVQEVFERG